MTAGVVIANPKGEAIQTRGVHPGLLRSARDDGERCHCAAHSLPIIFHYPFIIFNSREALMGMYYS
jgi:hypothetical protein